MSIELRWLRAERTTTEPDILQYRTWNRTVSTKGVIGIESGGWGNWQDVPVVIYNDWDELEPYGPGV